MLYRPPALLVVCVALAAGCSKPVDRVGEDGGPVGPTADPWGDAARGLRQDTEVATCRGVLGRLSGELAGRQPTEQVPVPAGLTPEAEAALKAVVPLEPADAAELRSPGFSSLDGAYLADALYLRDAARSLDVGGLPDAARAERAFAWVCRQLYLRPWVLAVDANARVSPALPPTAVLRRGSGSGLERAYVFLALLQQLNIDGCLIGPPGADGQVAAPPFAANSPAVPSGPFWAVGARVGDQILMFDPWRGEPYPGPNGVGVGTLAQIRARPEQVQAWLDDKTWGLTAEQLKQGTPFLAAPLSALSPRMAVADRQLRAEVGAVLAVNAADLRKRFGEPAVRFWNPPGDPFTYGRTLASFLPQAEGGRAPDPEFMRQFNGSLLPAEAFVFPELDRELRATYQRACAERYLTAFFLPQGGGTPARVLIQRGQLQDAARALTEQQAEFARGLERLRGEAVEARIRAFATRVNELQQKVLEAVGDPAAQAAARGELAQYQQAEAASLQLLVDRALAPVAAAEAAYLTALGKHEEAERAQARADRGGGEGSQQEARRAWRAAVSAWKAYITAETARTSLAGRVEHARALRDRATAQAP